MTDDRHDDRGRPRKPGGFRRNDRPRDAGGEKPLMRRETTWSPLPETGAEPRMLADGEIVKAPPPQREDRPFRGKNPGERPFRPREGGRPGTRPDFEKKVYRPRVERPERKPKGPPSTTRVVERAEGEERIAKVMARAGLCSRRDAEAWIEAGRVEVNGEKIVSPARNVGPRDDVRVDGKPLPRRERTRLWLFHKPRGLVTTQSDPEGRPTIFEALPDDLPRVVSIGRLDINTEGLLLLTNDGGLSRMLELPSTGWLRRYRVRAHGETDQAKLDALRAGITIDGIDYAGIEAQLDRQQGSNVWLTMGLREGKNREIKNVLEHLGLSVNRLIRLSFGPFQLGELEEGAVEEIKTRILADQLGPQLIEEAGVDFSAPLMDRSSEADVEPAPQPRPPRRAPREAREERVVEAPREPAAERPMGGKRKHISLIRSQARSGEDGPRRRIERAETADRKGRAVQVERVQAVRERPRAETRNARRFKNERDDRRAPHSKPRLETRPPERSERKPFRPRPDGERARPPRSEGAERPYRKPRDAGDVRRPPREGGERTFERRPRPEGEERPYRKPREDGERARPPRAGGDRPFKRDGDKKFGDRPPRRDSDRPRAPRPDGERPRAPRAGGDRPFKRDGDKKFGDRPPRRDSDRPRAPRAAGDRPPRRDGPPGGKPFRGKPGGGKPRGDGPRGPRPPRGEH